MTHDADTLREWGAQNVGILAYGSLLNDPGTELLQHIIARIPVKTPWPVEYARSSESRGGGPTLVLHARGAPVEGAVLVLDIKAADIDLARKYLRRREGTSTKNIEITKIAGLEAVLYANLPSNIKDAELTPGHLAELAIKSVERKPERNGIRYLADNVKNGILTPLTDAYRTAILSRLNADDLEAAERIATIKAKNRGHWLSWRRMVWLIVATLVLGFSLYKTLRNTGSAHFQITTHSTKKRPIKERPIPDAEVELVGQSDGPVRSAESDDQGLANLMHVPTGPYELNIRAWGFAESRGEVGVQASDEVLIDGLISWPVFTVRLSPLDGAKESGYSAWRDRTGRERTSEDLDEILDLHQKWASTVLGYGETSCNRLNAKDQTVEDTEGKKVSRADLAGAELVGDIGGFRANFGLNLSHKDLRCANLAGARLLKADLTFANLAGADLKGSDLTHAQLTGASMIETDMLDADLSGAAVGKVAFEPKSNPKMRGMASARYLDFITYSSNPDKLSELRKQFADNGYREQERSIVYAFRRSEAEKQLETASSLFADCSPKYSTLGISKEAISKQDIPVPAEIPQFSILRLFSSRCKQWDTARNYGAYWLETIFFDWTCEYGKNPFRALELMVVCWIAFALIYPVLIDRPLAHAGHKTPSGIYLVRKRNWKEGARLQQIRFAAHPIRTQLRGRLMAKVFCRELRIFRVSLCFSLLSSFNLGFRDASVGVWLRMLTRREYELKAVGGARVISGIQSLVGVYLFALWTLTTFGSPFA